MRPALIAFTILTVTACGGATTDTAEPDDGLETALTEFVGDASTGRWRQVYDHLHPAQRALVTPDQLVTCGEAASPTAAPVTNIEIVETSPERITIPGTDVTADATSVTFEMTLDVGGEEVRQVDTWHLTNVDGAWRMQLGDPAGCSNA